MPKRSRILARNACLHFEASNAANLRAFDRVAILRIKEMSRMTRSSRPSKYVRSLKATPYICRIRNLAYTEMSAIVKRCKYLLVLLPVKSRWIKMIKLFDFIFAAGEIQYWEAGMFSWLEMEERSLELIGLIYARVRFYGAFFCGGCTKKLSFEVGRFFLKRDQTLLYVLGCGCKFA